MSITKQNVENVLVQNPADLPDLTDDNVTLGASLAPKYYEGFVKEGDSVRAFYCGLTITRSRKNVKPGDPPKEIPTVVFQNKDGVFIHSGANLVSQLRNCSPGTAIQITYLGSEKTGSGNNINKFDARVLEVHPF
jgi:hypothetical protein